MNKQPKTLFQRIEDNFDDQTVWAKVGMVAATVAFMCLAASLIAAANGYTSIAHWAMYTSGVSLLTALLGFTGRPLHTTLTAIRTRGTRGRSG